MTDTANVDRDGPGLPTVVGASAAGTAFEWYDFFIFGSLTTIIARHFYADVGEATSYILALLTFGVGFVVRPLGALVFGWFGDKTGRKTTFLVTISLMGVATVAIGLLPDYGQIGIAAPILLLLMRVLQGFALGGEYGGAAIYVAEHAPAQKRGFLTGWIQTTAAIGLIMALSVILITRAILGAEAFDAWGWRIPFLLSSLLLVISLWIRLKLHESPAFKRMVAESTERQAPFKESFRHLEDRQVRPDCPGRHHVRPRGRLVRGLFLHALLHGAGAEGRGVDRRWADPGHHRGLRLSLCLLRMAVGSRGQEAGDDRRNDPVSGRGVPGLPCPDHRRKPGPRPGADLVARDRHC